MMQKTNWFVVILAGLIIGEAIFAYRWHLGFPD